MKKHGIRCMDDCKISVIIPVYNMGQYLEECLNSVLHQTISEKEIICVDDGSSDESAAILSAFSKANSSIKLITQNRKGVAYARNRGIEMASGEYIAFIDADDYYASNIVLEELYKNAKKNHVNIAGGRLLVYREGRIDKGGRAGAESTDFVKEGIFYYRDYQRIAGFTSFIYNRNFLVSNSLCFPEYSIFEDPPFMLKALSSANKIWTTSMDVYIYRQYEKLVDLKNKRVVNDIVHSFIEMACYAKMHNYYIVLDEIMKRVKHYELYFFLHIYYGSDSLYDLIQELDACFKDLSLKRCWGTDLTHKYIVSYIEAYKERISCLLEKMKNAEGIIIYGAGKQAQKLYMVIKGIQEINFLGFVVSHKNPCGVVGGVEVKSIMEYIDYNKKLLIVIAAREQYIPEMYDTASEYGFMNICSVSEDVVDVKGFANK